MKNGGGDDTSFLLSSHENERIQQTAAAITSSTNSNTRPHHPKLHPLQWWYILLTDTISDISNAITSNFQRYILLQKHPSDQDKPPSFLSRHCQHYLPFFSSSTAHSISLRKSNAPKYMFCLSCILLLSLQHVSVKLQLHESKKFDLAKEQSFGYFATTSNDKWKLKQQRVKEATRHAFPDDVLRFIDEPNAWYHNNWDPDFTCQHERKIGGSSLGDGPKWLCDPHRLAPSILYRQQHQATTTTETPESGCLIYSIGINTDGLNFEHEILDLLHKDDTNCEIHVFEPENEKFNNEMIKSSTLSIPEGSSITFHPWGIKGSTDVKDPYRFKSFQDTINLLKHNGRDIDILKVDCKMCEWNIYHDWFDVGKTGIGHIGQILVEVHGSPEHVVNDFFETLVNEQGYVIFHKEANTEFYGGNCQEYSFLKLRRDFFSSDYYNRGT